MLIVLAVFLILATIFIFSSQTAMVKTKLARTMQEQKLLARALDTYEADTSMVPTDAQGFGALPQTVLSRVPDDPFHSDRTKPTYQYFSHLSDRYKWVVVSVGPDGVSDVSSVLKDWRNAQVVLTGAPPAEGTALMTNAEADALIRARTYDPTNGSVSAGDVITVYGQ
jgi:type II secretory pathway pseudopilin PulG